MMAQSYETSRPRDQTLAFQLAFELDGYVIISMYRKST